MTLTPITLLRVSRFLLTTHLPQVVVIVTTHLRFHWAVRVFNNPTGLLGVHQDLSDNSPVLLLGCLGLVDDSPTPPLVGYRL